MRVCRGILIVRHRLGLVLANAGIDQSNVDHGDGPVALLLPLDPDATCRMLRTQLRALTGRQLGVMIIDSLGRAWRNGTVGTALGLAGVPSLVDLRGQPDIYGRALQSSELGQADEIAAAASLLMGQANEKCPIVVIRGLGLPAAEGAATDLIRPLSTDLFQ
jgi:coenzyme F420-0:L-glutamate ligase/coenzyme F420-1:gamma-L-glutamate ligase